MDHIKRFLLFCLSGLLVVAALPDDGTAIDGPFPRLEADLSIEVIGEPKIGEPFEVVFTCTPLEETLPSGHDQLSLHIDYAGAYLSGDTLWEGSLEKGVTYRLRATFVVDDSVSWFAAGKGEAYPAGRGRAYTGVRSPSFDWRPARVKDNRQRVPRIIVTDSGTYYADTTTDSATALFLDELPPPRPKPVLELVPAEGTHRAAPVGADTTERKPRTQIIHLGDTPLDTVKAVVRAGATYQLAGIPGSEEVRLSVAHGKCDLELIERGIYKFDLQSDSAAIHVNWAKTRRIVVVYKSQYYQLIGNASFVDPDGIHHPIRHCQVCVFYYDPDWGYLPDHCVKTGDDGTFLTVTDYDHIAVCAYSIADPCAVVYDQDHNFFDDDLPNAVLKYYTRCFSAQNPDYQNIEFHDTLFCFDSLSESGDFNIIDAYLDATGYLSGDLGAYDLPPQTLVIWDDEDSSKTTSCFNGFICNGIPGIYIASKSNSDMNWDEWDEGVLMHEYGHCVMYHYMESIPGAGGPHEWPYPYGEYPLRLAFSEAWAHFFSSAVRDDPVVINSTTTDPMWIVHSLEQPLEDAPYYLLGDLLTGLPNGVAQYEGCHVEGSIAATLWDIFDQADDGDYYSSGVVWGHNNDHNSGVSWSGIDAIWDVMTNFDPQPDNPDHEHCWTMYEFLDGWYKRGYTSSQVFKDICEAHCVQGFIPGDVDCSCDEVIDISDLIYLIDYMFTGGPQPWKPSAADVNSDAQIDISDLTVLNDYMFLQAAAPLAGCISLFESSAGWSWDPSIHDGCEISWP